MTPLRHSSKAPKTKHKLPKNNNNNNKPSDALKIHNRILNCVYFKLMVNYTSESKVNFHMITVNICMYVKSLQSCSTLCNPMDRRPWGSSVHEILQARILEWVVISFSRWSSQPRDPTHVFYISCTGRRFLYH